MKTRSCTGVEKMTIIRSETGATFVECMLTLACIVLVLMMGIPTVEEQVSSRIESGTDLWTTYDWEIGSSSS